MFIAVVSPLILGAISKAWFGHREQRLQLNELLQAEARSAADRIQTFVDGIRDQIGWVVQFPWTEGDDAPHKIDAERLLHGLADIAAATGFADQNHLSRWVRRVHGVSPTELRVR